MKKIEIGGKERPVLYGINALSEFNENTGTSLQWIFSIMTKPLSMNMNHLRWLVFCGLKMGAEESNIPVDFDIKTVGNWLDKDFNKLSEFMEALRDGLPKGEETKKKVESDSISITWDEILKIGIGTLRLRPWELKRFTLRELMYLVDEETKRSQKDTQLAWEVARWQSANMAGVMGAKIHSVYSICVFPWETPPPKPTEDILSKFPKTLN